VHQIVELLLEQLLIEQLTAVVRSMRARNSAMRSS
jgi:hypothetical protein